MTTIAILLYNLFISPLFILASHIGALFHKKVRAGVVGRYQTFPRIKSYFRQHPREADAPLFLFHCASMGEFEHIKPLLAKFKQALPGSRIVVMFFSPSGFQNVAEFPAVDLFIYSPMDIWYRVNRLYGLLKPTALFIAKHDVWPNQVWVAHRRRIPAYMINASLHKASSRIRPVVRTFQRTVYDKFNRIFIIAETDKLRWQMLSDERKVTVVGDTKYDQALYRCQESRRQTWLPKSFTEDNFVFVAGSTWPEDETQLFMAFGRLLPFFSKLRVVICPHEPTESRLIQLREAYADFETTLFSRISEGGDARIILVDKIGILANIYSEAHIAYVGGSFRQNIHNVLEPAVYGIPVMFGPINQNSHEAQLLKKCGGGVEIRNGHDLRVLLDRFMQEEDFRKRVGEKARRMVESHSGSTARTLEAIFSELGLKPLAS